MRRLIAMVLTIILVLAGCAAPRAAQSAPLTSPNSTASSTQTPEVKATINLYFPDKNAVKLLVEKRELDHPGPATPQMVVDQLILGPKTNSNAVGLIPQGTTAKVTQNGDLVTVDFSQEICHANLGSSGEALLINSLLACLFEFPSIQSIQILVEGQQVDTLAGHVVISQPLSRRSK